MESPHIQETICHLDILQEWLTTHTSIMERWESKKYFGFSAMMQSAHYSTTLAKILSLSMPIQGAETTGLFSCTGLQKLDNLVNRVKSQALEFLNQVLRYIFEKVTSKVKVTSPFLPRCIQFCPYLIKSLLSLTARPDIETIVQDEVYSEIIVEAIETVVLFAGEPEF